MSIIYQNADATISNEIIKTRYDIDKILLQAGIEAAAIVEVHNQLSNLEVRLRNQIQFTTRGGKDEKN